MKPSHLNRLRTELVCCEARNPAFQVGRGVLTAPVPGGLGTARLTLGSWAVSPTGEGAGRHTRGRVCSPSPIAALLRSLVLALALTAAAADFSAWPQRQELRVPAPGLIKLSLPLDTLDAARAGLEDLRLLDPQGNEVPYLVERFARPQGVTRPARTFKAILESGMTVLTLETGFAQPIDAVTLETPAASFIKPVQLEGSLDGVMWQSLARGVPIFRQSGGAVQLQLAVREGTWPFLRLTVDDRGSAPIPFAGAHVRAALPDGSPGEAIDVQIVERYEAATQTRLELKLPATHLTLAELSIETTDPLFTRPVTLAACQLVENAVKEQPLTRGTVYRVALPGQPISANLAIPIEAPVLSRELVLLIDNGSSPPLNITAVRAARRPTYLVFLARQAGTHAVLTGNRLAEAPRYDLVGLAASLQGVEVLALAMSAVAPNPSFRPAETLPQVPDRGTTLDVSAWKYRKQVQVTGRGVQQLELDLEVLSRASASFHDLRLMRDGEQLPYLVEHTSLRRIVEPVAVLAPDPKRPRASRWSVQLPQRSLPLEELRVTTRTPLFERHVVLLEEAQDGRGARYVRSLGQAHWTRTPERTGERFSLALATSPESDRLLLETDNGDNPAIELGGFEFTYPATRLIFKVSDTEGLYLYYENREVAAPRYDLALVAESFMAADRRVARLGPEEQLKGSRWMAGAPLAGMKGVLFWGVLGLVVIVLLVVISRLLPKGVD